MKSLAEILANADRVLRQKPENDGTPRKIHPLKEFRFSDYWPLDSNDGKEWRETSARIDLFEHNSEVVDQLQIILPGCEIVIHTHDSKMPCYAKDNCRRIC